MKHIELFLSQMGTKVNVSRLIDAITYENRQVLSLHPLTLTGTRLTYYRTDVSPFKKITSDISFDLSLSVVVPLDISDACGFVVPALWTTI